MKTIFYYILTGLLLSFSWPTYGFSYLAFVALVPLLYANFSQAKKGTSFLKLFFLNYISFLIWNVFVTGWLYYSSEFGMLFAVLVNSALMSLLVCAVFKLRRKLNFTASSSLFISSWLSFEYLHYHWDFSWPWLTFGNVFSEATYLIQWYEYTGVFGGSLWVLIANFLVLKSILLFVKYKQNTLLYRAGFQLLLLIGMPAVTSYIVTPNLASDATIETLVIQPNIDPYQEKYKRSDAELKTQLIAQIDHLLKPGQPQLILAPETVFAGGTEWAKYSTSYAKQFTDAILKKNPQANLIFGISGYDLIRDPSKVAVQSNQIRSDLWYNDYNSAVFAKQSTTGFYHKSKLVVGVENFPYKALLQPILGDIMLDLGGTVATKTTQDTRTVFPISDQIRVAPIICYESVYGEYVTDYVKNGASVLAIITNDAWWGNTQGHQQHWSYAKLRAIETRKAVARSANTGISGFINRDGSILSQTEYDTKTVQVAQLPVYTEAPTFYVTYGNIIPRLAILLGAIILLFSVTKRP